MKALFRATKKSNTRGKGDSNFTSKAEKGDKKYFSAIDRGTQRIVSVNYLFGRPVIPYNFLKGIFTSNFLDMGNLRPSVFGLTKMSFRVP